MRVLTGYPGDLLRSCFQRREAMPLDPRHTDVPTLRGADVAAVYYKVRVAGDFYEFLRVGSSRVLFALLDLAGRRDDTREILIAREAKHGGLSGSSGRPKRVDYGALVLRLIDKTDAGKLAWKPAAETRHFSCALEGTLPLCAGDSNIKPRYSTPS